MRMAALPPAAVMVKGLRRISKFLASREVDSIDGRNKDPTAGPSVSFPFTSTNGIPTFDQLGVITQYNPGK